MPSSPMLRFRLRKDFGRRINRLFGTHRVSRLCANKGIRSFLEIGTTKEIES